MLTWFYHIILCNFIGLLISRFTDGQSIMAAYGDQWNNEDAERIGMCPVTLHYTCHVIQMFLWEPFSKRNDVSDQFP